ncbi:MAG TPA: MgtC/SapB family protein [Paenibacillus sp.]|nr:MgtC/SapB family protein [Paenibacillus sp.]HZG57124.1 MgtC/SapB family protein [Paenibacillus sp.]
MSLVLLKIGLSALFGLVIGIDRELKKKPLGLKTCLVLAVSSCLLTIVSIQAAYDFPKVGHMMMDPLRLAAQIVSGIGFIGAGVILKRHDDVISGLTTAAMIWSASGLGIAVGAGYYREAGISLLIILIGVDLIPYLLRRWGPDALTSKEILVAFVVRDVEHYAGLKEHLARHEIKVKGTKVTELDDQTFRFELRAQVHEHSLVVDVFRDIRKYEHVCKLDVRSL